jgi:hypothetical protein
MSARSAVDVSPNTSTALPPMYVGRVELSALDVHCDSNNSISSEGVTMVLGNSSASPSERLTASEWDAIVSSLAFITIWFGISFA